MNTTESAPATPVLPLTIDVPRAMVASLSAKKADPQTEMMMQMALGAFTDDASEEQKFIDAFKVISSMLDKPGKWQLSFDGALIVQLTVTP